jgi:predicted RNA-binding Zn-ribbon protein involved in translation (DUF1610 family)
VYRSRKTDQRSHFQTVDSSCRSSAQIKENPSKTPFPNCGQFLLSSVQIKENRSKKPFPIRGLFL